MKVYSPFDKKSECELIRKIDKNLIIEAYSKFFSIDVSRFFKGVSEVCIFKCPLTSLQFYYPLNLDGDSEFYERLSDGSWYYQTVRWEHKYVSKYLNISDSILEIGSGAGAFASILRELGFNNYLGLELNDAAVKKACEQKLNVRSQSLSEHLLVNKNAYDAVCSFQVFEHISDIESVFKLSIEALKKEGKLIVAVPNNEACFLKENILSSRFLNMPPHHVNLFTPVSLKKIGEYYGLKIEKIEIEPIQDMHIDTYLYNKFYTILFRLELLVKILWKLRIHYAFRPLIRLRREKIAGHTVLVIFSKH
jgi:2-polyprenyl-3-methyl-5-hydroxy-6-metoxy-1,4-benzoquinol methylase